MGNAYNYMTDYGITSYADYPYTAETDPCTATGKIPVLKLDGVGYIRNYNG
jgi:hypothetical protein